MREEVKDEIQLAVWNWSNKPETIKEFQVFMKTQEQETVIKFLRMYSIMCGDESVATAKNRNNVIREIAECGILPIQRHMMYWRIGEDIAWTPKIQGLVYAAARDRIIKRLSVEVVCAPDILKTLNPYAMTETEYARWVDLGKPSFLHLKMQGEHDREKLIGCIVNKTYWDNTTKQDIVWKDELERTFEGFATFKNSKAWEYTWEQMIMKMAGKKSLKLDRETVGEGCGFFDKIVEVDNRNYDVGRKTEEKSVKAVEKKTRTLDQVIESIITEGEAENVETAE